MPDKREVLLSGIREALRKEAAPALRDRLAGVRAEDLAEILDLFDFDSQKRVVDCLDDPVAAEVLADLEEAVRVPLIESLPPDRVHKIVAELEPDDAADMVAELPEKESAEILEHIPKEKSAAIERLLTYPPETAGGLMTPIVFKSPANMTVRDAIRSLRGRDDVDEDEIFNLYVTDGDGRLAGRIPIACLLTAQPETMLNELILPEVVSVSVHDDQEKVVNILRKYDLVNVPVVDDSGRLMGRITHDDVLDVADEEAAEDLYRMAGTDPGELESAGILHAARVRFTWLLPCMMGASVTAAIMAWFAQEPLYPFFLILAPFSPLINSTGGNTGIQTSTMIVRGLATGDLSYSRLVLVLVREGRVALMLATVCSVTAGVLVRLAEPFLHNIDAAVKTGGTSAVSIVHVGCSVGLGMFCAIIVANVLGIMLPFGFKRFGIDPAIASGPLITTTNDMLSVLIYFSIGTGILMWL